MKVTIVRTALVLIAIGLGVAVLGTTWEAAKPCWFDVLRFDGELNGLDWTGRGAIVASAGLLLLLVDFPRWSAGSTLKWELAGTLLLSLYWGSDAALHVILETLDIRRIEPRLDTFLIVYFTPMRLADKAIWPLQRLTCEQRYGVFVETALFGAVVSITCWWLAVGYVRRSLNARIHG